jgi:V/A-type H+-transporting ATPase subunit C
MAHEVYPRMNTLVKLRENSFLTASERNELLRAVSPDGLYKSLTASGFFSFAQPKSAEDLPTALDEERKGWLDWAREISPSAYLTEIFQLSDIAHNVRVYIKERTVERDFSALYEPSKYSKSAIAALLEEGAEKRRPIERAIASVVEDALADYAIHQSFLRIDLLVKFFYHKELLRLARALDDAKIIEIITAVVDLDILSVIAQQPDAGDVTPSLLEKAECGLLGPKLDALMFASPAEQNAVLSGTPYSELWGTVSRQGSRALFDALADNFVLEKCRIGRLTPFGLLPLFALVMAKFLEIKNVRLILESKRMGAEQSEIAKRVRDEYAL